MTGPPGDDPPRPLAVVVVLDGATPRAWQAAAIERLEASGAGRVVLVVAAGASPAKARSAARARSLPAPPARSMAGLAFHLFAARVSRPRALRDARSVPWQDSVDVLPAVVRAGPAARPELRDEDIEAIRGYRPDAVLWLGAGEPAGGVLGVAPHGAWWFRHGDLDRPAGDPPGFRELADGVPVVGVALCRAGGDAGRTEILRAGWFAVAPHSYARTVDRMLIGAAGWPALACQELMTGTPPRNPEPGDGSPLPERPGARAAGAGTLLRFLGRTGRARIAQLWHHGLRHDDWNVGIVDAPVASLLAGDSVIAATWAPTRGGRYAADPFGSWDGSTLQVLFEDYAHARGTAVIASREWSRDGGWGAPRLSLDIGSHLSYPFLVEHDGRRYLLPESRASGRLTLYAAEDAGDGWQPAATLDVDGGIADATMLRHDGLWWLLAARPDTLNPSTELGVWYARRPEGPWQAHPQNPVLVDVRSARPAGPPFTVDGQLYRPAQDCSTGYGDRVVIKRIVTMTTERYEEEAVAVVRPDPAGPFPHGVHTLTGVGPITLVDGKRRVWNTAALVRVIRSRLHR